jgi:hypothetical protein
MQSVQIEMTVTTVTAACFMLVSCLASSSALRMEGTCSSEMSVDFQRTARRNILEDSILHKHRRENLKMQNQLCFCAGTDKVNEMDHTITHLSSVVSKCQDPVCFVVAVSVSCVRNKLKQKITEFQRKHIFQQNMSRTELNCKICTHKDKGV